ncbi:MAG: zinc-ribbon domain-containing protein, partial [Coriobacteriales bacterium]
MKCPGCDSEIIDDAKFCPNCGVELDKVATVEVDPEATGILGAPVAQQPGMDAQGTPAAGFEPVSGMAPSAPARPAFAVPSQMPSADVCPSCGAPVVEGDAFCGNCGMRLGTPVAGPSYQRMPPAPAPQVMSAGRPISSQELECRYSAAGGD